MFLEYREKAAHPGLTDRDVQRCDGFENEGLQALPGSGLRQMPAQFVELMRLDQAQQDIDVLVSGRFASGLTTQHL